MPTTTPDILHVTNGDLAAARIEAAVGGPVLPWRDVLHEGPVPADLDLEALSAVRARFIAEAGWGLHDRVAADFRARDRALRAARGEVVLWFEHDLYDQLQLVQLLAELAGIRPRRLRIVQTDDFLSNLDANRLRVEFDDRLEVDQRQLEAAAVVWSAFRASDPRRLAALAGQPSPFPHLPAALRRLLEEYPGEDGLARSERQILATLHAGASTPARLFAACGRAEPAPFMGDVVFRTRLLGLMEAGLVTSFEGWQLPIAATAHGLHVLAGGRAPVRAGWIGGVALGRACRWRYDASRGKIIADAPRMCP